MLKRGRAAIALALAGALLAVVPSGSANADDPVCPHVFPDNRPERKLYIWDGSESDSWGIAANWDRNEVPNDDHNDHLPDESGDATPETDITYVCIPDDMTVVMNEHDLSVHSPASNQVSVQAFYLGQGASLTVPQGVGLFSMSHTIPSVTESESTLTVVAGSLGGEGTIQVNGTVSVSGTSSFASALVSASLLQPAFSQAGTLAVESPDGELVLPSYGVNLKRKYRIQVAGQARLTANGFFAVWDEASLTVRPDATLELGGVGGLYSNDDRAIAFPLVNEGTLLKTGGGTGLIETPYSQPGDGQISVMDGTLAFADGTQFSAEVSPGKTLSTATCAPHGPFQPCVAETNPARDATSVALQAPSGTPKPVQVSEVPGKPLEFVAHLVESVVNPAVITFRLGVSAIGTTNPAEVEVVHENEPTDLPDCAGSALPPGLTNCVDRVASRYDSPTGNVYMVVRSIDTSRYVCHKEDAPPPPPPPPEVTADGSRWKKLKKAVTISTTANQSGTLTISAVVTARRKKPISLGTVTTNIVAGQPVPVTLKKLRERQRRKLEDARKVKVEATITVTSSTGSTTTTEVVKLS